MADLPTHLRGAPMGGSRISRAELATHQRERVISKVAPIIAKRGYQACTVDDLLASGKVGVGNFYSLFQGKEDCFLACFERITDEVTQGTETALSGVPDWDTRAYLALKNALDYLCAEPLSARIILVEAQSAGEAATARYTALIDQAVEWLTDGRRVHPDATELPTHFEQAAISGLAFYLQQCLLEARRLSPEQLLSEAAALTLEPIMGSERLRRVSRAVQDQVVS